LHQDLQALEDAREDFERLLQEHVLPEHDVLTTTSRHRRELEMNLLASLADSDGAIEELMHLWMYEHGSDAANALIEMEEVASPGLEREQAILTEMLEAYPTWVENQVRLATLLYYKGETQQSRQIVRDALKIKPWHFEAVQLLVMLALRDGDLGKAIVVARQSLPPLGSKRRDKWVNGAVREAKAQYHYLLRKQSDSSDLEAEVWQ
jgi:tetratricopeptide (TPR) repeat protein